MKINEAQAEAMIRRETNSHLNVAWKLSEKGRGRERRVWKFTGERGAKGSFGLNKRRKRH